MLCVVFHRARKPVVAGAVADEVELTFSPLYNQVSVFVYVGSIEVVLARKSSLSHTHSLIHSLSHSLSYLLTHSLTHEYSFLLFHPLYDHFYFPE